MKQQRVVITGMGCISSVGCRALDTWDALVTQRSGIRAVEEFSHFPVNVYAPAVTSDPDILMADVRPQLRQNATLPMMLFHAAVREAFESSCLKRASHTTQIGLIGGTTANYPVELSCEDLSMYYDCSNGSNIDWDKYLTTHIYPHSHFFRHTTNLLTCIPAIHFGFSGINETLHNACASGTLAVGQAYRLIKHGYADIILAGASEALVNLAGVTAMTKLGVLSSQRDPTLSCRPFDLDRDGLVLGEGAAVLVLESLKSASARRVQVLAEIVGFGSTANAYRVTDSPIDGIAAASAITQCLTEAEVSPPAISVVSAHATSTKQNDVSECNAIKRALGSYGVEVPVFALKSLLGHSLSASGAIELVAALYTLTTGIVPGIPSYRTPDKECNLNVVRSTYQDRSITYLLKNSFGFGGQNGAILLKKWQED